MKIRPHRIPRKLRRVELTTHHRESLVSVCLHHDPIPSRLQAGDRTIGRSFHIPEGGPRHDHLRNLAQKHGWTERPGPHLSQGGLPTHSTMIYEPEPGGHDE